MLKELQNLVHNCADGRLSGSHPSRTRIRLLRPAGNFEGAGHGRQRQGKRGDIQDTSRHLRRERQEHADWDQGLWARPGPSYDSGGLCCFWHMSGVRAA